MSQENVSAHAEVTQDAVSAQIDSLNIPEDLKTKLRFVHDEFLGLSAFGIFGAKYKSLKNRGLDLWKMVNWWALIFPPIYYIIKGMWKKGIILGVLMVVGLLIFPIIDMIICCIAGNSAYPDLYRKLVKKEDFWW